MPERPSANSAACLPLNAHSSTLSSHALRYRKPDVFWESRLNIGGFPVFESVSSTARLTDMDINTAKQTVHSPAFMVQSWIAFGLSFGAALMGIYYLPVSTWPRAFLAMSLAMTVSSAFTLAKTIRDAHEANQLVKRVDNARVEDILTKQETRRPPTA